MFTGQCPKCFTTNVHSHKVTSFCSYSQYSRTAFFGIKFVCMANSNFSMKKVAFMMLLYLRPVVIQHTCCA